MGKKKFGKNLLLIVGLPFLFAKCDIAETPLELRERILHSHVDYINSTYAGFDTAYGEMIKDIRRGKTLEHFYID